MVDFNYIFECDWLIGLSDNKLSDNNLTSELVETRTFLNQSTIEEIVIFMINIGNRTEWSPIQSVIIRVINKIGRPRSGSPICYHEYDYRLNWTTRSPVTN